MNERPVVVVGAGAGGLAAALDLGRAGLPVTVVEAGHGPGGKIRSIDVAGAPVDSGPTVLTMRWVFEELFADAGASLADRVGLEKAEILARHAWREGEHLDLFHDDERSTDAIGRFAGAAAARGYQTFRRRAGEIYRILEPSFIRAPRPTPMSLVFSAGGVTELLRIKPYDTMWRELSGSFADPRLRQLFGRYATYCGSSPFEAPATLVLVAHVELEGVWRVHGGMGRLPEAMATLAGEKGVRFRYGETVREIVLERGKVSGVILGSGERVPASTVVLNGDAAALGAGLFGREVRGAVSKVPPEARSLSAVTLSVNAPATGFPLTRHNVFFSADYEAEFKDLVGRRRLPFEPTVYVCAQDRGDDDAQRAGPERLFVILNAPPTGDRDPWTPDVVEPYVRSAMSLLRRNGLQVEASPDNTVITTPADLERRFPGTGGAIYGRAVHGAMATFQRPASRTRVPGLYLAGGSVHPGAGVPMATLSGRLAAKAVLEDVPVRQRMWRPVHG